MEINYNVRKRNKPDAIVHRASPIPSTDDYCCSECGRWLDVDDYIVTTKPVTCAQCLKILHKNEEKE